MSVALYVIMFLLIQLLTSMVVVGIQFLCNGATLTRVAQMAGEGGLLPDSNGLVIISVVSSLLTLALFIALRWAQPSRSYLLTRPWATLAWVVVLALGTIIPATYVQELVPYDMPADMKALLAEMLHNRWGYLAVGIVVPVAEELVFRGAVLRALLQGLGDGGWQKWCAIGVSALIFGAVHGNVPQGLHATIIGLLLGWMYWRTRSIVPGVAFHWVNNSAAYVIANVIPNSEDARLVDIFRGSQLHVYLAILFSLLIMVPALFQLYLRLHKGQEQK